MVEAEGDIEGRVSVPGAFGVEEDRAARADQNVLRRDVAVHEGLLAGERLARKPHQLLGDARVLLGRRLQIGLQADRMKNVVRREACGDRRVAGRARMDRRDAAPDLGRRLRIDVAVAQLRLPHRIFFRREIGHGEQAGFRIMPEQFRDGIGDDAGRHLHPGRLVAVALDRRAPVGGDLELRQRTLDGEDAARPPSL